MHMGNKTASLSRPAEGVECLIRGLQAEYARLLSWLSFAGRVRGCRHTKNEFGQPTDLANISNLVQQSRQCLRTIKATNVTLSECFSPQRSRRHQQMTVPHPQMQGQQGVAPPSSLSVDKGEKKSKHVSSPHFSLPEPFPP